MNNIKSHGKFFYCFFGRRIKSKKNELVSANCAYNKGDSDFIVNKNRKLVSNLLNGKDIIIPHQTHSNTVLKVEEKIHSSFQCDALITSRNDILLGILTADCAPIIVIGKKYFGIIHVGWKGLINNIIEHTIFKLNKLGEDSINLNVFVGPHLKKVSFEVKSDFISIFKNKVIKHDEFLFEKNKKIYFDFSKLIKFKLLRCNIDKILISSQNTYTKPKNFFSHRYCYVNKIKNCGRQISLVGIKNN